MKNLLIVFFISVFCFGCTNGFEEMNTNPNKQSSLSNSQAILQAQISLATELMESRETGFGKWVQYYTGDINATRSFHTDDVDIFWNYQTLHVSSLRSIEEVMRNTDLNPHANYRGMASILKSWTYLYMTDLLGPVPYFDSTKGDLPGADLSAYRPKFDSQEVIYKDVNEKLKEANTTMEDDPESLLAIEKSVDIFAGGNILLWRKFANSLRARMLVRMSDADPDYAQKELSELFGNPAQYPVLESNDDDFGVVWVGGPNASYANQLAEFYRQNEFTWPASSGLVNLLGRLNDPRMEVYYEPAKGTVKAGNPLFVGAPTAMNIEKFQALKRDTISQVNKLFAKHEQKKYIFTYAELLFVKSEAALKNRISGNAADFYQEGIRAHLQKCNIKNEQIQRYLEQPDVSFTAQTALEQIITQRYIAMFFQARDIYPEIRRTGYPVLDYFRIGTNTADVAKGYPEKHMYPGSSETRRSEYFKALGVNDNTMWGCKLWFASKRNRDVIYTGTIPPTALTGWKKTPMGYEAVTIPYEEKK